jgi:hypothetical protein
MQLGYNTNETSHTLWTDALNVSDTSSKARGKVKKVEIIHYPQFELASQMMDDQYWRVILHNCAKKKFPRGFTFSDGVLKHRTNNISIVLPDDPNYLAQTAIYFFQENGKLYSKRDQEIRKKRDEDLILSQLANASNSWTCISRSKNRRATYIRDYVERKFSSLPQKIRDEIYTQINVSFEIKYITKDHVIFENGQLLFIDGIDANEHKVWYTRPLPTKRSIVAEKIIQTQPKCWQHYNNWQKWISEYQKYLISSTKSNHTLLQSSNYLSGHFDSENDLS